MRLGRTRGGGGVLVSVVAGGAGALSPPPPVGVPFPLRHQNRANKRGTAANATKIRLDRGWWMRRPKGPTSCGIAATAARAPPEDPTCFSKPKFPIADQPFCRSNSLSAAFSRQKQPKTKPKMSSIFIHDLQWTSSCLILLLLPQATRQTTEDTSTGRKTRAFSLSSKIFSTY